MGNDEVRLTERIKDVEVEKVVGPGDSNIVKLGSLWEEQGVVLHFLRRFGCPLCRVIAADLQKLVPYFEENNFRVVAVGIEKFGLEEFQAGNFWNGELYIDDGKKALKVLELKSVGMFSAMKQLVFSKDVKDLYKKSRASKVKGNMKGDGLQLGATFVIGKGGEILLDHRQRNFAHRPSNDALLMAVGIEDTEAKNISTQIGDSDLKECPRT